MPRETACTALTRDELDTIEDYRKRVNTDRSTAMRQLIRKGLAVEGETTPFPVRLRAAMETSGVLSIGLSLSTFFVVMLGFYLGELTGLLLTALLSTAAIFALVSLLFALGLVLDIPRRMSLRKPVVADGGVEQ